MDEIYHGNITPRSLCTFTRLSLVTLHTETFEPIMSRKTGATILAGVWKTVIQRMLYTGNSYKMKKKRYYWFISDMKDEKKPRYRWNEFTNRKQYKTTDHRKLETYRYSCSRHNSIVMDKCTRNQCLFQYKFRHSCRVFYSSSLSLWEDLKKNYDIKTKEVGLQQLFLRQTVLLLLG